MCAFAASTHDHSAWNSCVVELVQYLSRGRCRTAFILVVVRLDQTFEIRWLCPCRRLRSVSRILMVR
jgi:hypothetical protein